MKWCSSCLEEKPSKAFNKHAKRGLQSKCRDCARAYKAARSDRWRDLKLQKRYGITYAEYQVRLEEQAGVCAICAEPPPPGVLLQVDHCHTTTRVRGLLCRQCNSGLGHFRDNQEILDSAILYLVAS